MKFSGFEEIDPDVRAFILIVIVIVIAIVLGLVGAGFIVGKNHAHLLTCEDFEISGLYVPADCRPSSTS